MLDEKPSNEVNLLIGYFHPYDKAAIINAICRDHEKIADFCGRAKLDETGVRAVIRQHLRKHKNAPGKV